MLRAAIDFQKAEATGEIVTLDINRGSTIDVHQDRIVIDGPDFDIFAADSSNGMNDVVRSVMIASLRGEYVPTAGGAGRCSYRPDPVVGTLPDEEHAGGGSRRALRQCRRYSQTRNHDNRRSALSRSIRVCSLALISTSRLTA